MGRVGHGNFTVKDLYVSLLLDICSKLLDGIISSKGGKDYT